MLQFIRGRPHGCVLFPIYFDTDRRRISRPKLPPRTPTPLPRTNCIFIAGLNDEMAHSPLPGLNTTGTKNDANLTAVAKRSHMVAPKVLSTSLFCSKCLGVFWFFVRKIIVTKQRGVDWRAGGVLAAFCFLSKLHRVGANFVKYWCSVYLTGKKENRCQGIICKKNATCGRCSVPCLQDFSASYQIFSVISKKRLTKALQAQFNAVAKSAASSAIF